MAKKKACKKCRIIVEPGNNNCPICKGNQFSETWKGRIIILKEDSELAEKLKLKGKGDFVVKA